MNEQEPLIAKLHRGEFIVSVQIDPPTTATHNLCEMAGELKKAGVKIVDINSSRRVSCDSLHTATALGAMGFTALPHITARDASANGLINQCLGAYSLGGVRNFLAITGDPYETAQSFSNHRGVFHVDAINILHALSTHLRNREKESLRFSLGAAINQNETDLALEGRRLQAKESAGANFLMSQPVFTRHEAEALMRFKATHTALPLIVGIWPLIHQKTIETIYAGRIVGVKLGSTVYDEAREHFSDPAALNFWGLLHALELIRFIRENKIASGVYIVAPSRNPLLIVDLAHASM